MAGSFEEMSLLKVAEKAGQSDFRQPQGPDSGSSANGRVNAILGQWPRGMSR